MSSFDARARIDRALIGQKYILPAPFSVGIGVFTFQSEWQIHGTEPFLQIALMKPINPNEVSTEGFNQGAGKHRDPVFLSLAVADQ